jgi:hypothetical protein
LNHWRALRGVISSVSSVKLLLVLLVMTLSSSVLLSPLLPFSALRRQNLRAASRDVE